MQLHCHKHGWLIADSARAVAEAALHVFDAALVLAKGKLAGPHLHACAIHGLDPPAPTQGDYPLRSRIFVPLADPAYWLHREYCGGLASRLPVIPLRIGRTDTA
jgi:hypothetical protein